MARVETALAYDQSVPLKAGLGRLELLAALVADEIPNTGKKIIRFAHYSRPLLGGMLHTRGADAALWNPLFWNAFVWKAAITTQNPPALLIASLTWWLQHRYLQLIQAKCLY